MVGRPLKIQHALRLENPTGCFSFTFKNPSEILFCKIRRKIHHALENPAVFWVLQTPLFFPTSVEHGAPHESSALTFFHEQRAAPIECSTLATRCLLTLILGVQELSLVAWHYRLYQRRWNPRFFGVQGLGFCTGISCHRTPGRWHHCSSGTWWVFSFPLVPGDFSP